MQRGEALEREEPPLGAICRTWRWESWAHRLADPDQGANPHSENYFVFLASSCNEIKLIKEIFKLNTQGKKPTSWYSDVLSNVISQRKWWNPDCSEHLKPDRTKQLVPLSKLRQTISHLQAGIIPADKLSLRQDSIFSLCALTNMTGQARPRTGSSFSTLPACTHPGARQARTGGAGRWDTLLCSQTEERNQRNPQNPKWKRSSIKCLWLCLCRQASEKLCLKDYLGI